MELRGYQTNSVDAVLAEWMRVQRTMLVLATGLGKTVVAAHIVKQRQAIGRCMFLVHRRELLEQAVDKIYRVTGERPDVEMGDRWANEHGYFGGKSPFIVSSIQTQVAGMGGKGRMTRFNPLDFSTIVTDECHHATSDSWRRVINYYLDGNPNCRMVGLTATPDRADGVAMRKVFESCAFKMDIREGIDDGYLVPIKIAMPTIHEMDFSTCRTTAGDLNQADLATVLEDEKVLHQIVKYTVDTVPDKKVLAFAASKLEAEKLTEIFNRYDPDSARYVIDSTPENTRKEIIQRYRCDEFKRLINCSVFTEGFDVPGVEVVIPKPTKSRSLFCLGHDTEILTAKGWMGIDSSDADLATPAVFDPTTLAVRWGKLLGRVERWAEPGESFVEIDSQQIGFRVTDQHRMVWRNREGRDRRRTPWKITTAIDMASWREMVEVPVSGIQESFGSPLTDDELRFIGWVLTDGTINKVNHGIQISQAKHQPWNTDIEKCLQGCGFKYVRSEIKRIGSHKDASPAWLYTISKGKPRKTDKHLTGWGRLEGYVGKTIGPWAEELDRRQFSVLLEAIHMGDGSKQLGQSWTRRSYHIATGRKEVADYLQSLCVRRGFACNVAQANYNKNPLYILHIKDKQTRSVAITKPDRTSVKVTPATTTNRVWCIETDAGTIITRRHGKVLFTGNCQMLGRGTRPQEGIVDSWPSPVERQAAIAASTKPHMLVIDFVGVSGQHKLMTALDVLAGNDEAAVRRVKSKAERDGQPIDIDAEVAAAKADIEAERKANEARMREFIKASRMRASVEFVDAFDAFDLRAPRKDARRFQEDPTHSQIAFLQKQGIDPDGISKGDAGRLIAAIRDRWQKGLCSHRDAAILKAANKPANVSRDEAKRMIAAMAGDAVTAPTSRAPRQASDPSGPCTRQQAEVLARFNYPTDVTQGQAAEAIREINQRIRGKELTPV